MLHLSLFLKFHNTTLDGLIALKPDTIRDMLLKYIIHLKKTAKTIAGKPTMGEICVNSVPVYMTDRHPVIPRFSRNPNSMEKGLQIFT
jgi:hypothetical protein